MEQVATETRQRRYSMKAEKEIIKIIRAGVGQNRSQREIAEDLNERGYTLKSGQPWTQPTVSSFAIRNGLRLVPRYSKKGSEKDTPQVKAVVRPHNVDQLKMDWTPATAITEIMQMNGAMSHQSRTYLMQLISDDLQSRLR
jgi:hypothetical protein